jgi:hypothetical protein
MHLNLDAVAILGRANPEGLGVSPFSPSASGICIHPAGFVATAFHTLQNFQATWSPFEIPSAPGTELMIDDAERHERPFFAFPTRAIWEGFSEWEADVIPMRYANGNPERDVAVVKLGDPRERGVLPFVSIASEVPRVGETVSFAGLYQAAERRVDAHGYLSGVQLIQKAVEVIDVRPEGFIIDYEVRGGMSGSGVCNSRGALVGVISERWEPLRSARLLGINRAVGLVRYAQWVVEEYHILCTILSRYEAENDSG